MTPPVVSVVLPTWNRAAHLARSAGSVLEQSFRDLELLVVDDGSTDDTRGAVAALADPRVRYIRRESNGGVAAARNTGVQAARGLYLAFQDSDDLWLPGKLERQLSDLQPLDQRSMSVCGLTRRGGDRDNAWQLDYPRAPADWRGGLDRHAVLASGVAYTQTWLVPRQAVIDCGMFDERLRVWDDWDLLIRLAGRLTLRTRQEPLVDSSRGADSLSVDASRFAHDLPLIQAKYREELHGRRRDEALLEHLYAVQLRKAGRAAESRAALLRCLRRWPAHWPAWRMLARALLAPDTRPRA